MKYLILLPFAVLIGLAVGSWVPKQELVKIRNEMKELQKEADKRNQGGKLSALSSIIKIPEKKAKPKSHLHGFKFVTSDTESQMIHADTTTNLNQVAANTNTPSSKRKRRQRQFPDPKSETYEADLEEAKELWETRVELARAQWLAKLDLKEEEIELFDQAIANMNDKLYQTMQITADELQNAESMSTETGLRIMNSVTETLVETYDQIGEIVPVEQRSEIEELDMPDFIDPAAFEPLIDVRDKL
jgi:hypothetical protein